MCPVIYAVHRFRPSLAPISPVTSIFYKSNQDYEILEQLDTTSQAFCACLQRSIVDHVSAVQCPGIPPPFALTFLKIKTQGTDITERMLRSLNASRNESNEAWRKSIP